MNLDSILESHLEHNEPEGGFAEGEGPSKPQLCGWHIEVCDAIYAQPGWTSECSGLFGKCQK